MLQKIKKDITDEDIDALFNSNDTAVLQKIEKLIPQELSLEQKEKSNHVDRPKENVDSIETQIKKQKKEQEKLTDDTIDKNVLNVKTVSGLDQLKKYIKAILKYRLAEREKEIKTKEIVNQYGDTSQVDKSTECTFHIYQPKHIMGDTIYACCKFCSASKEFKQDEWDEYCIKYRKWF